MIFSDVDSVISHEHSTSPGVNTVHERSDHLIVRAIDTLSSTHLTTSETGNENTANRLQPER